MDKSQSSTPRLLPSLIDTWPELRIPGIMVRMALRRLIKSIPVSRPPATPADKEILAAPIELGRMYPTGHSSPIPPGMTIPPTVSGLIPDWLDGPTLDQIMSAPTGTRIKLTNNETGEQTMIQTAGLVTTTMTGPTSEPPVDPGTEVHRVRLLETHEVTMPHRGTGRDIDAVVAQCRLAAEDWAETNGVAITPTPISGSDGRAGVTFDIELGHGSMDDLAVPGSLWSWSARFHVWLEALAKVANRERRTGRIIARPANGIASVTTISSGHRSMSGTGTPPTLHQSTQPGGPTVNDLPDPSDYNA